MGVTDCIKSSLHRLLGDKKFLQLLSKGFLTLHNLGLLQKKHPELYLNKVFVKSGAVCIDIGANLGYYSIPLAQWAGKNGKIYAVEPVELFREVLLSNIKNYHFTKNVEVIPFALGANNNTKITMGTPALNGVMHHGYTKVLKDNSHQALPIVKTYEVTMRHPATLFADLNQIDFIKCDIEGFEIEVMPLFYDIVAKHLPVMQIEICENNHCQQLVDLFKQLGYGAFFLFEGSLQPIINKEVKKPSTCDVFFLPNDGKNFSNLLFN